MSGHYMVSVANNTTPTKKFTDLTTAKVEAIRVSLIPVNSLAVIHVVQIIATLEPRTSHEWSKA